jgi:WD40 repeat protein
MDGSSSDFLLACTASGEVQVWDLRTSALLSIGAAHSDEVTMAKWAPDGKQVVSVGKDACICVWNWYGSGAPPQ